MYKRRIKCNNITPFALQMALSAAEKQRRYRQRRDADSETRKQYLQKEKEKYEKDKALGKKKLVKDLSKRQHRALKKQWREYKRVQKMKRNEVQTMINMTPPHSPEEIPGPSTSKSRQKNQGTVIRNRNRAKLHKKITMLENLFSKERKRAEMFRERLIRSKAHNSKDKLITFDNQDTPRTKTRKPLRNFSKDSKKTEKL